MLASSFIGMIDRKRFVVRSYLQEHVRGFESEAIELFFQSRRGPLKVLALLRRPEM